MQLSQLQCRDLLPSTRGELISSSGLVVAEFPITDTEGLIVFESSNKLYPAPYIWPASSARPRRAIAGEGISAKLLSAVLPNGLTTDFEFRKYASERNIGADQTNESIIIDEKIVIKWHLIVEDSLAVIKERLLLANQFHLSPKLLGNIYWNGLVLATINEFIEDVQDGWSWCVKSALKNDKSWIDSLAQLTIKMHQSLAPYIHGDFHVGQILKKNGANQFWVIDFEGDPLLNVHQRSEQSDKNQDIASMCASFFHVGAVAIKNGADNLTTHSWIVDVERQFLQMLEYNQKEIQEMHKSMLFLQQREMRYANDFLPQWRYAPEFAITLMEKLGYGD